MCYKLIATSSYLVYYSTSNCLSGLCCTPYTLCTSPCLSSAVVVSHGIRWHSATSQVGPLSNKTVYLLHRTRVMPPSSASLRSDLMDLWTQLRLCSVYYIRRILGDCFSPVAQYSTVPFASQKNPGKQGLPRLSGSRKGGQENKSRVPCLCCRNCKDPPYTNHNVL